MFLPLPSGLVLFLNIWFVFFSMSLPDGNTIFWKQLQKVLINSIKSDSSKAFQQHQEHSQILIQFSVWVLFKFHSENGSIINSFHIVAPNSLKPSQCTHTHQEKIPRAHREALWCGTSQCDKTKQNKLPCFIDRSVFCWWLFFAIWGQRTIQCRLIIQSNFVKKHVPKSSCEWYSHHKNWTKNLVNQCF